MSASDDALRRIVRETGSPDIVETLAALPGADFTSLMLHVMRARVNKVTPAKLLQQFERDRFVSPWTVSVRDIRAAEEHLLRALPESCDLVGLSPLAPFGASHTIATVDQHKIVSALRNTEVVSDPTNVLALEAALRRRADRDATTVVQLATFQRVVRAQQFFRPRSFAHFQLFGMLSAGRDRGNQAFELQEIAAHLQVQLAAMRAAGAEALRVAVTDFTGAWDATVRALVHEVVADEVVRDPDRPNGAGYYEGLCFKVFATFAGETLELGDGGVVDWTQQLVGSQKERCVISGVGAERLAAVMMMRR